MANYKVPQDVEADDKLIGPFSFRQFVYLGIVVAAIGVGYLLAKISLMLTFIPLPVVILFGALALPLRRDQPMETYMAAVVSYYMRPRRRLWCPDGRESLVQIIAPITNDEPVLKNISEAEAERRFSYLAEITDSQGWAIRGVGYQAPNSAMNSDVYFAAQQVQDILDDEDRVNQDLDQKLNQGDNERRQKMIDLVQGRTTSQSKFNYFIPQPDQSLTNTTPQTVVNPFATPQQQLDQNPPINTSENTVSADIIDYAMNHTDLSVAAIERGANRNQQKKDSEKEVLISFR